LFHHPCTTHPPQEADERRKKEARAKAEAEAKARREQPRTMGSKENAKKDGGNRRRTLNINAQSQEKGIMDDLVAELSSGSAFRSDRKNRRQARTAAPAMVATPPPKSAAESTATPPALSNTEC